MFAVTVMFRLAPGRASEFLPLMQKNAATSRDSEPGCLQFDICRDPDRPDEVFLYEIYTDAAAFDAHLASAHFKAFDKEVQPMIAAKTVQRFSEVTQ